MQRRGERGQSTKGKRKIGPKARNAPTASVSGADLQGQLDRRTRELDEALQQQTATSEVLSIIRRSPADAQPVFDAIVQSAARLCGAIFGVVYLYENDRLRIAATNNFSPEATSQLHDLQQLKRPDRSHTGGRTILDRAVVHIHDVLKDPEYSRELALAGGWRAVLGVPLVHDGQSVGAITLGKREPTPFSEQQIQLLKTFADQAVIAIENVRLFEAEQQRTRELSESLEQQTATSEVLKVISSSPGELQPVFEAMLANATRICEAELGHLFLREGTIFRAVAISKQSSHVDLRSNPVLDVRDNPGTPIDLLFKTKQVVHIPDLQSHQSYIGRNNRIVPLVEVGGARTFATVPMLKEGELIGAISMYRQEVRPFTDKQIELVKNFADQAVIAIENTRLLNELRESLQQQTATSEVLKVISSSPGELEPIFDAMLANATRICGATTGTLYLYEGTQFRGVATHHSEQSYVDYWRHNPIVELKKHSEAPLARLATTKRVVHIPDLRTDQSYLKKTGRIVALVEVAGVRTVVLVPMIKEGELVGAINLYRKEVRPFTEKQIALLENFAAQAVIAIENARLLNELRQRTDDLSESLEQQTATADVLNIIASSPGELEPVFEAMLANATQICGAEFGLLYRSEGDMFRTVSLYGAPPAFAEQRRLNPMLRPSPGTALGRVVATKGMVQIADVQAEPAYQADPLRRATFLDLAGARTVVCVPMLKEKELIGAISIYRQEVRPFTDKQIALLTNFASQAVIAIENVRLLNELRESLQQQTATSDVLKVISSSLNDLKPVFETIGQRAEKLCDAEISVISMVDGDQIRLVSINGVSEEGVEAVRRVYPMPRDAETVTARAIRSAAICHVPDVLADARYQTKDAARVSGFRASLGVPMIRDDQVIGAIFVARRQPGLFAYSQVQLLRTFADQAVVAIENVRLFNETKEALSQQTATADVLKVISRSTFDLRTVLKTLIESASRLCDADKGNITRAKDGVFYRAAESVGYSREFIDHLKDKPIESDRGSATGRALYEARVIHIPDVKTDPEYTLVEAQKLGDYRTVLAVPMLREGVALGVLTLTRSDVRPFSEKQIELVTTFADQAAIAIENVRLFDSVEQRTRELAKSLEELRTTQDRLVQTQKLASLGQLTAGIAHEIKNPLNFVNNFSGLSSELIDELQDTLKGISLNDKARAEINELTATLRGNLEKVVQHGKRADAIVKNMLLHSREGSGEHRVIDVNALVEESLNLAWHGARAEKQGFDITLERSFDPTAGEADLYPQDITRVLLNLLSNGFYAAIQRQAETNGGGYVPTLAASTRSLGDRVEIRIRDNGTGIPPEVKEKMFNPFFTTKPAGEGTGLGLSICHDIIVKQHGGSIEVETQPGEFTEIRVTLPRVAASLS